MDGKTAVIIAVALGIAVMGLVAYNYSVVLL